MANVLSRIYNAFETWSFKYNCYEAVHPWTPYCTDSALELGLTVFEQAIKLYTPLYLFSQVIQRKFDYSSFERSAQSILRSTTFISANAFFAIFFFCSSHQLTGKFYYYAVAYLPAFLGSSMAVMIEKPNRRSSLAFYVANVASETLFKICVGRGFIKPVNNGQVYLFTLSIATLMWLSKKHGFEDDPLSSAIEVIVGGEEAATRKQRKLKRTRSLEVQTNNVSTNTNTNTATTIITTTTTKRLETIEENEPVSWGLSTPLPRPMNPQMNIIERCKNIFSWFKFIFQARHKLCPHNSSCSCLYYCSKASIRAFLIGTSAQVGLRLLPRLKLLYLNPMKLILEPQNLITIDSSLFQMGLFLSTFSGLYKLTNCLLRWSSDKSEPINCFLAGLIAGPSLLFYPSPTVALYVTWKCLEALFNEGVRNNIIKNKNLLIVILYGLSTSQLFYSALMDPRYMKKSYMAFLDRMTHHKLHLVNRSVLDVFGTEASSGYEEYFPDLHPNYMSKAFLGSIWLWMIEQKFSVAK